MNDLHMGQLRVWNTKIERYMFPLRKSGKAFVLLRRPECLGPKRDGWIYFDIESSSEDWAWPDTLSECSDPVEKQ